jgi:predicted DNA-binding transcriptional regulator AlpA
MGFKKTFTRFSKVANMMKKATKYMRDFMHRSDDGKATNKWLYSTEVMDMLQISESTLRRMRKKGEIPCEKIGGTYRYPSIYLDKILLEKTMERFHKKFDEEKD